MTGHDAYLADARKGFALLTGVECKAQYEVWGRFEYGAFDASDPADEDCPACRDRDRSLGRICRGGIDCAGYCPDCLNGGND